MHSEQAEKLLLTEADLAAMGLGSRSNLRKLKLNGDLVPLKLGKMVRYRRQDVDDFINKLAEAQGGSDGI